MPDAVFHACLSRLPDGAWLPPIRGTRLVVRESACVVYTARRGTWSPDGSSASVRSYALAVLGLRGVSPPEAGWGGPNFRSWCTRRPESESRELSLSRGGERASSSGGLIRGGNSTRFVCRYVGCCVGVTGMVNGTCLSFYVCVCVKGRGKTFFTRPPPS